MKLIALGLGLLLVSGAWAHAGSFDSIDLISTQCARVKANAGLRLFAASTGAHAPGQRANLEKGQVVKVLGASADKNRVLLRVGEGSNSFTAYAANAQFYLEKSDCPPHFKAPPLSLERRQEIKFVSGQPLAMKAPSADANNRPKVMHAVYRQHANSKTEAAVAEVSTTCAKCGVRNSRAELKSIPVNLVVSTQTDVAKVSDSSLWALPLAPGPGISINRIDHRSIDPKTGKLVTYPAADIGAVIGTPVLATESGVVRTVVRGCPNNSSAGDGGVPRVEHACRGGEAGNYVEIDHGNGQISRYLHLDDKSLSSVSVGQAVEKGARIGAVGNSGMTSGPHLHFEVRINNRLQHPAVVFGKSQLALYSRGGARTQIGKTP